MPLYLHNTLTGATEEFAPLKNRQVTMYNCGPTVYDVQHIGNLRSYVFADILKRTLTYNGYTVKQVINITDVGHLTGDNEGDADTGEDKMVKALNREGLSMSLENMQEIGRQYEKRFLEDLQKLNVTKATETPRASEHVEGMIALIQTLVEKGYAYTITDGVYYDTSRFAEYGKLGGINTSDSDEHSRVGINEEKHHPSDFALWKFNEEFGWDSPWGKGFPGWHIECSAMSMQYLGKTFDIHTGGTDHIAIHHNNEIAQSEAATGKPFARYWLHNEFITIESRKISKSIGNTVYLYNLEDRGYSPLVFRYWLLTGHYRSPLNFTWEALDGAKAALFRLHRYFIEDLGTKTGSVSKEYQSQFQEYINDDLNTAKAIALLWEVVHDETLSDADKRATILDFDAVLALGFTQSSKSLVNLLSGKEQRIAVEQAPEEVQELVQKREDARKEKDFSLADSLRDEIEQLGYEVQDTPEGPELSVHESGQQ